MFKNWPVEGHQGVPGSVLSQGSPEVQALVTRGQAMIARGSIGVIEGSQGVSEGVSEM